MKELSNTIIYLSFDFITTIWAL